MKKLALILAFVVLAGLGPPERMLLTGYSPAREEAFIQSQSPTADIDVPNSEIERGPIVHFTCEDNAASTVVTNKANSSLNGVASRNTSSWTTASGKVGRGLDFYNGDIDDRIDLGSDVIVAEQDFTFCAWIKPGSVGETAGRIFTSSSGDTPALYLSSTGSAITWSAVSGESTGATWAVDTWMHVCLIRSGSSMAFYKDGVEIGPIATPTTSALIRYIGSNSGNTRSFDGILDDIRIYDYALSPAQIAHIYNQGAGHQNLASKAKANVLTVDATPAVMSVQDKQGVEFYQSTAASRATLTTMNGRRALLFDGVDDAMTSLATYGDIYAAGAKTAFFAVRPGAVATGTLQGLLWASNLYGRVALSDAAASVQHHSYDTADRYAYSPATLIAGKPLIAGAVHSNGNLYAYANNVIGAAGAASNTGNMTGTLVLGNIVALNRPLNGSLQRLTTFNKVLSPYARDRISKHLCRQAGASCN